MAARRRTIFKSWLGSLLDDLRRVEDGEILALLREDGDFQDAVLREMYRPGHTKDDTARRVADIFSRYAEQARERCRKAGADIDPWDGRMPLPHDPWEILRHGRGGRQGWAAFTAERLDTAGSFPEIGDDPARLRERLDDLREAIVVGPGDPVAALEDDGLRFRDADAALEYLRRYGRGNLLDAMADHLDRAARVAALLERLGPAPETLLKSLVPTKKDRLRTVQGDAGMPPESSDGPAGAFSADGIRRRLAELAGETGRPAHPSAARVAHLERAGERAAATGKTVLPLVADVFVKVCSMRVRGLTWPEALARDLTRHVRSHPGEERGIARSLGVFVRAVLGDMHAWWDADVRGCPADLRNILFKYSGHPWLVERSRAGFALWLSAYLGEAAETTFDGLDPTRRSLLLRHGIHGARWEALRRMTETTEDGRTLLVPSRSRDVPEAVVDNLLSEALGNTAPEANTDAPKQRARALSRLRRDVSALIVEETCRAVGTHDDTVPETSRQMFRSDLPAAEFWRAVLRSGSLPVAYLQQATRRERTTGHDGSRPDVGDTSPQSIDGLTAHTLGTLTFGFAAVILEDLAEGRTPCDPNAVTTQLAVAVRSGSAGIYGAFVSALADRFENVTTGTSFGRTAEAGEPFFPAVPENTVNLWFTRAALDWRLLRHIREWMCPGASARLERKMRGSLSSLPHWPKNAPVFRTTHGS